VKSFMVLLSSLFLFVCGNEMNEQIYSIYSPENLDVEHNKLASRFVLAEFT